MSIESLIDFYFYILTILIVLSWIILLTYWIKLIHYIRWKKPEYWKRLYVAGILPRGRNFFRFYYGKEDFKDKKIKGYKSKFRKFLLTSLILFLLLLVSIIIIGIFIHPLL